MAVATLFRLIGILLVILAVAQMVPLAVAFGLEEEAGIAAFAFGAGGSMFFGVVLVMVGTGGGGKFGRREAVVLAVSAWFLLSLFAAVPLAASGAADGLTGSIFEAISGLTTTGLSVFANVDEVLRSVIIWRALLQWLGGFATILFAVSLVPQIGAVLQSGWSASDAQGNSASLRPRLRQIGPAVGVTYVGLTFLCLIGLLITGVPVLDAACYAMSVISTGGFVPNSGGPFAYDSVGVLLVLVAGMLVGAVAFTLHWVAVTGRPSVYLRDPETGFLLLLVAAGTAIVFIDLAVFPERRSGEGAIDALWQVVSAATTTGFAAPGHSDMPVFIILVLSGFVLVGGASVSTAGGLKLMRTLLLVRQSSRELERLVHPHGVMLIKLGRASVTDRAMQNIWAFFVLFVFCLILFGAALSAVGLSFDYALLLALSAMANTGPVLLQAAAMPTDAAALNEIARWIVAIAMLVGRLEIFALLILLSPMFWKR